MSLIQIGEVVDCLNLQLVTLLVSASGGYNSRGKWEAGASPTVVPNVKADVQPATGRILQLVPEGERTQEHVSAWFTQLVDTTAEAVATKAALMVYRGVIWKCIAVPEDWRENGFVECLFQNTKEVYAP